MCDNPRVPLQVGAQPVRAQPPKAPEPLPETGSQVVFSSWLKKKSPRSLLGRHIWEARYFVLYPDRLVYYKRYEDSSDVNKYAGCIMLADIDSVIAQTASSTSTRYRFNIQLANSDKVFQLMSDGEEVDKGKKWNVLLLDMLPERGSARVGVGKFWKPGAETPLNEGLPRRRASSIRRQPVYAGRSSFSGVTAAMGETKKEQMTQEDKDLVLLVIADTRVALKNLDMPTKEKMLGVMVKKQYQTGQVCVKVGEPNSLFYVVKSGSFSGLKANKKVTFSMGMCFCEEDILSEQNATMTITAIEESVCWCLDRYAYREVLVQSNLGRSAQYLSFLSANRLLSALSEADLRQLASALEEADYGAGEEIVTQGDPAQSFYIVKSGECEVIKDGLKVAHYWEGDSFGERALLQGVTRAATVVALTDVVVLALNRTTFTNLLGPLESIKTKQAKEEKPAELAAYEVGDRLEVQTPKGPQKGTVKYVGNPHFTKRARLGLELDLPMGKHDGHSKGQRYFKCASKHGVFVAADEVISVIQKAPAPVPRPMNSKRLLDVAAASSPTETFKHSNVKPPQADPSGDADEAKRATAKTIGPNGAKNADELLYGQLGLAASTEPRQGGPRHTRFSTDDAPLQRPEAKEPMAGVAAAAASAAAAAAAVGSNEAKQNGGAAVSAIAQPPRDHKPCKVDEFTEIGELGRGTFGTVKLVTDPNTQFTYALKQIDKQYLIKQNQVEFVKNERLCLSMMDNPFLIKMYAAAMDARNIYFILEPAMGGELFNLLNEKEKFIPTHAQFYAASIVMAFEYMHSIGIVYRDLKPENILLDDVGYVKLTDFGFAKQLGNGKTYTFCGTPDYLSPEIVSNEGHGFGTDWWCLGILIYEMLTGTTPFYDEAGPLAMYEKIVNAPVTYPDFVSDAARDLIGGLLQKKEAKRIGVLNGGAAVIKQHPFFNGFDWNTLVARTLPAPFLKPLKSKFDLSHFAEFTRPDDTEGEPE